MIAHDLWKEGRLDDAIEAQTAEVKSNPTDSERRYFLFALLCFTGDLERAARQLDAVGIQDEKLQAGALIYRNLLASEAERRRVYSGATDPLLPGNPPESLTLRVEAIQAAGLSDWEWAGRTLHRAAEKVSLVSGTCDGEKFDRLEDTDEFLGPVFEIFAGGRFLLMPFERIRTLEISEPKHVLDLLWVPAHLEDTEGNVADVHLPVLYQGSNEDERDSIRLGRETEWFDSGAGVRGRGQKVLSLMTGGEGGQEDDRALLSVRSLELASGGDAGRAGG
jgi:type VI secretion system protein ImpE